MEERPILIRKEERNHPTKRRRRKVNNHLPSPLLSNRSFYFAQPHAIMIWYLNNLLYSILIYPILPGLGRKFLSRSFRKVLNRFSGESTPKEFVEALQNNNSANATIDQTLTEAELDHLRAVLFKESGKWHQKFVEEGGLTALLYLIAQELSSFR